MKYMLMVYIDESWYQGRPKAEVEQRTGSYMAFAKALSEAKVAVAMDRLQSSATATTVRTVGGKTQVLNGPYPDSKEQFGGFFVIDVADLDAALAWAARCPAAQHGVVEVRPLAAGAG